MRGLRGFFTRDQRGAISGVDLAGRLFTRVATAPVNATQLNSEQEGRP